MGGHGIEQSPRPPWQIAEPAEHRKGTLLHRQRGIDDEFFGIDAVNVAEAITGRTGTQRTVEAEQLRLRGVIADAAGHTGILARKDKIGRGVGRLAFWL